MIDPEAVPDPRVVTGLEANKLPSDPLCQIASWSRWKFHFFLWGVEEDGEKMRGLRSVIQMMRWTRS
jgi:hypothetical protein